MVMLAGLLGACVSEVGDDDDFDETIFIEEGDVPAEGTTAGFTISPRCSANGPLSRSACALLGTIAFAEGTHAHYNYTYAYRTFSSFRDHPRIRVCAGSYCSTAAGRYQILSGTWNGIRTGLADFSPPNQDKAALKLIRGRGVTNIDSIDTYAEFTAAIYKLNREWASLPGSPYGQPRKPMSALWTEFKRLYGM
jgi:muramidase (phage lysozyme)